MNRRGFLFGLAGAFAAPPIVRASSLMSLSLVPDLSRRYATIITADPFEMEYPKFPEPYVGLASKYVGLASKAEGQILEYDPASKLLIKRESVANKLLATTRFSRPRMTLAQIEQWNTLRKHTGLIMEPVLG